MLILPFLAAFGASVLVGAFYAAVRVRSPAPPPIALIGLGGILLAQTVLEPVFQ